MPYTLDEIIKEVALQETTSDIVVRQNIIREFIYRGAGLLTDAVMLFPEVGYNQLDIKGEINTHIDVDYPVAEGAVGPEGRITWMPFNFSLEKAEGSFKITDEAKVRQQANLQWQTGVKSLSRAMARKKNYNILEIMIAGYTITNNTGGAWDSGSPKIIEDMQTAINALLESDTADLTMQDIGKMVIALPIKAFNLAAQLTTIANIKMSFADYLKGQFPGIKLVPFKELSTSAGLGGGNDGYVVVAGTDTGRHGVFRGGGIPLVEEKRDGAATKYTVRQYFKSKVVPDSDTVATSSRIARMASILGTP